MITHLRFLGTCVRLDVDDAAVETFRPVLRFFRHLLTDTPPSAEPTFRVTVGAYDPDVDVPAAVWETDPVDVRRSSAPEFTFAAHLVEQGARRLYVNRATLLDTPRDAYVDPTFHLRVTPGSTVQALDFLRDLVIRHEEQQGTVVLHASGVTDGTRAVAVAGPKGAGKTTTLLSMLRHGGWQYFTGDKMFCRTTPSGVEVHPWRDYPYVGVGTIRADARLTRLVRDHVDPDLDLRGPTEKLLMDPDLFEDWLGSPFDARPQPLAALVLPRVVPGRPLRTTPVTERNARWAALQKAIDRQADTSFFTWQSYLVPDYTSFFASLAALHESLADVPFVRVEGTLEIDPDALLARFAAPGRPTGAAVPAGAAS